MLKHLLTDKVIHERVRLFIVTLLASSDKKSCSFGEIQKKLDMTSGNLSVQLKTLGEAGYVTITKQFKDNKPLTTVSLTPEGRVALTTYVDEMEAVLLSLKVSR